MQVPNVHRALGYGHYKDIATTPTLGYRHYKGVVTTPTLGYCHYNDVAPTPMLGYWHYKEVGACFAQCRSRLQAVESRADVRFVRAIEASLDQAASGLARADIEADDAADAVGPWLALASSG